MGKHIRRGTIFKNGSTGLETYFIYDGAAPKLYASEEAKANGMEVHLKDGVWRICRAQYYRRSLSDVEHFPVIGYVDLDDIIMKAAIEEIAKAQ